MWKRGDVLRDIRLDRGWTQEALAVRINLSAEQYRRYEAGAEEPPIEVVVYLCIVLDTTPCHLMGWGSLQDTIATDMES